MSKRTSYVIKKAILLSVKEKEASYASLERKINTGYRTIKDNCEELKDFGQVRITVLKHPSNGRQSHIVRITREGNNFLRKLK